MTSVELRDLAPDELSLVAEIDRTEQIDLVYAQDGVELVELRGDWSAPPWAVEGDGEHSVRAQVRTLERYAAAGGISRGAFVDGRLVGIATLVPHVRPTIAQLAYLHVSYGHRSAGIGGQLVDELERIAREGGDDEMVVSATPSHNTVRFYSGRGFRPTAEPLAELYELEPDDIHMSKRL